MWHYVYNSQILFCIIHQKYLFLLKKISNFFWIFKKNFSKLVNDGDWVYFQIVYLHRHFSHSFYIKLIKINMEAEKKTIRDIFNRNNK